MPAIAEKEKPLLPPDEKFWKRYSSHHEFPLASVSSVFMHGLVLGALGLAAFFIWQHRESEEIKPVRMDVITEAPGSGPEGASGAPGLPGDPGTEVQQNVASEKPTISPPDVPKLVDTPKFQFDVPEPFLVSNDPDALLASLDELTKDAKKTIEKPNPPVNPPTVSKNGNTGQTRPGKGGQGGQGGGGGTGKKGFGPGDGGGVGRIATKQQIYAQRWRFDLSGNGKEHATKLTAVGVTLGMRDPRGKFLVVQDLTKRPVHVRADQEGKYVGAVIWANTKPESIQALAKELQLNFIPQAVLMMLPKDREEKMAELEADYARRNGRDPNHIQATWFDFRLQDGVYEPVVIDQR